MYLPRRSLPLFLCSVVLAGPPTSTVAEQIATTGSVPHFFLDAPAVTQAVPVQGGLLILPGYAEVGFAPGSFARTQSVKVSATRTPETARDWEATAFLFDARMRTPYEVRINTGRATPAKDFEITLEVPAALLPTCEGCEVNLFAQFFEDGGEEVLDSFELVDASYSAKSQTLTATLSADLFTHRRTKDATFEAIVLLGVRQRGEVR